MSQESDVCCTTSMYDIQNRCIPDEIDLVYFKTCIITHNNNVIEQNINVSMFDILSALNFMSEISTSKCKSEKCCADLQRTALEIKGRQTRPINPSLVQHPKWGIQHLTSSKADGLTHTHLATNCGKVTPAKQ